MSEIDQISKILGNIEAKLESLLDSNKQTEKKLDKIGDISIIHGQKIEAAHRRIDNIEGFVEEFKSLKNKGLGIVSVLSLVIGFIGYFVSKILQGLF